MSRLRSFLVVFSVVCIITITWGSLYVAFRKVSGRTEPPFEYTATQYTPEHAILCPGEQLRYVVGFRITRVPTVIPAASSWLNLDTHTIVGVDPSFTFPWSRPFENYHYPVSVTVPKLQPGHYARIAGGGDPLSATAYEVDFVIPTGCK